MIDRAARERRQARSRRGTGKTSGAAIRPGPGNAIRRVQNTKLGVRSNPGSTGPDALKLFQPLTASPALV